MLAFLIAYLGLEWHSWAGHIRQLGVVLGCFAGVAAPAFFRIWYLYQTRATHVFASTPAFRVFVRALAPGKIPFIFAGVVLYAALARKLSRPTNQNLRQLVICAAFAVIPAVLLYGVTVTTPLHIFIGRYQGVFVPGVALCWAWVLSLIESKVLRGLCCAALVLTGVYTSYTSPVAHAHGYSWKGALEFADANAAREGSPLVICSDLPEADFRSMPEFQANESALFSPLSYYKVRAQVVPMPRSLNQEAQRIGRRVFLQAAIKRNVSWPWAFGLRIRPWSG